MRFRKYRGPDVPSVLRRVRRELGEEAVIVKTEEKVEGGILGFFGTRVVEVLVALPDGVSAERPPVGLDLSLPREVPESVGSSKGGCVLSLPPNASQDEEVISLDGDEGGRKGDEDRLDARDFLPLGVVLEDGGYPRRVIAFGPPGSGKTSTLGRLAWHFSSHERVKLISVEEEGRLSGVSRWRSFWEVLGVDFLPVKGFQGLEKIAHEIKGVVLVDTPPLTKGYREELEAACRGLSLTPLLVVDAAWDLEEFRRLLDAFRHLPGLRVVVSKMDSLMVAGRREVWRRELMGLSSYMSDSPSINCPLKPLVHAAVRGEGVSRGLGQSYTPVSSGGRQMRRTEDLWGGDSPGDIGGENATKTTSRTDSGAEKKARVWVPRRIVKG